MKVVHVNFYYEESFMDEEVLLEKYYTVTGWAEALQRQGAEVIVANRFNKESSLQRNGVQYYFLKDRLGGALKSWQLPLSFLSKVASLNADVIHLHQLMLSLQTVALRFLLDKKTAMIVQHHGGGLPERKRRIVHNFLNRVSDGFFFATVDQGKEWFMNEDPYGIIMPVMEGATFFNYADRDVASILAYSDRNAAKSTTGMSGAPVFLWVGRLDHNKDPLTILEGFEILFEKYPGAHLYMIYGDDKLSNEVGSKVTSSEILRNKVHLLGKIPHDEIVAYYNSADYFVLGSHYEGSGYALSEALSCGCVPVITDIPSFRMMTNGGQLGALWETGNKNSFVAAVSAAVNKPLKNEANACIDFYRRTLSFDAIASVAMAHYRKVKGTRSQNG